MRALSMKKRRKQPRRADAEAPPKASGVERRRAQGRGVGKVVLEHALHLRGERRITDHRGNLEIQAERAIVEIGRADQKCVAVDNGDLLVQKSGLPCVETAGR
jgi:hypothetical protein